MGEQRQDETNSATLRDREEQEQLTPEPPGTASSVAR